MPGDPHMHSPGKDLSLLPLNPAERFRSNGEAWNHHCMVFDVFEYWCPLPKNKLIPHAQQAECGTYILYKDNHQKNLSSLTEKKP